VITETFACGTEAVVTAVSSVHDGPIGGWRIGDGKPGPVTTTLRKALTAIHHGLAPAPRGWMYPIPSSED
jgi:branched-chain amino acid aminotransferase